MATIDVTYSRMASARKQLLAEAGEYKEEIRKIAAVAAELGDQWEGDAQAAFDAEQMKAMEFYSRMQERVTLCAQTLSNAVTQYSKADHTAMEIIRSANK